ncbi:cobalt-precorrin 5A hydrolase [Intestinibacter bartlettii]|uniref:Cobalt-precorrin 5A hydrolase n=2 Tax=Intestinibacter bartlettii TaxID=261299 RepID=A0ABS6DWM5_9FIRM|nr:cobalt-precorrin 5A hydrolase [Intestinibacter bartlettii]
MNTENNIAIVCITDNGKNLAIKIQQKLKEGQIYFVKKKNNEGFQEDCNIGNDNYPVNNDKLELRQQNSENIIRVEQKLRDFVPTIFNKYKFIVFIMATGIVVRTIAPLIQSKFKDPAVIVTDERGTNIISLLSGHMGGANEMTLYISHLIDSNPVITTATDVNNKSSLDMIAKNLNGYIENFRDNVLKVNSMIVNNKPVGLFIDENYDINTSGFTILKYKDIIKLNNIENNEELNNIEKIVVISDKQNLDFKSEKIIKLVPRDIVLGVGCKKNIDSQHMKESLKEFLQINNIDINSIKAIGSIEVKKEEQAIIDLANYLDVPFETFTVEEISQVDYLYSKSEWVKKNVGVYSVAEPCAHLLSKGNLIIEKQKFNGITFSAGRVNK